MDTMRSQHCDVFIRVPVGKQSPSHRWAYALPMRCLQVFHLLRWGAVRGAVRVAMALRRWVRIRVHGALWRWIRLESLSRRRSVPNIFRRDSYPDHSRRSILCLINRRRRCCTITAGYTSISDADMIVLHIPSPCFRANVPAGIYTMARPPIYWHTVWPAAVLVIDTAARTGNFSGPYPFVDICPCYDRIIGWIDNSRLLSSCLFATLCQFHVPSCYCPLHLWSYSLTPYRHGSLSYMTRHHFRR